MVLNIKITFSGSSSHLGLGDIFTQSCLRLEMGKLLNNFDQDSANTTEKEANLNLGLNLAFYFVMIFLCYIKSWSCFDLFENKHEFTLFY